MSKIMIPESDLRKLYNEERLSQITISSIYNTTPQTVCRWMSKYGIAARSASDASSVKIQLSSDLIDDIWRFYDTGLNREEIAEKLDITAWAVRKTIEGNCRGKGLSLRFWHERHTTPLSYIQEQVILGSLLGDASLICDADDRYDFQVGHCLEQKEWLQYKCQVLGTNMRSYIKGEDSYSAGKIFFTTSYGNKYELKRIYELCFHNGKKTVSEGWAQQLGALAIAVWFMDDGTSSFSKNVVTARFSTLSFPKEQLVILQARLKEFGIETTLQKHTDGYGLVIAIRQGSINRFMDLIEPYVVDCMKYKIKRRSNEPNFRFTSKDTRRANGIL